MLGLRYAASDSNFAHSESNACSLRGSLPLDSSSSQVSNYDQGGRTSLASAMAGILTGAPSSVASPPGSITPDANSGQEANAPSILEARGLEGSEIAEDEAVIEAKRRNMLARQMSAHKKKKKTQEIRLVLDIDFDASHWSLILDIIFRLLGLINTYM